MASASVQRRVAALVRIDEDLGEGIERRFPVAIPMRLEIRQQLRVGGWRQGHQVLGEELQLLRQAATDDLVVLVQPHGQGFAIEDGLADVLLDETVELFGCRRPAPAFPPARLHPLDFAGTDDNGLVGFFRDRFDDRVIQEIDRNADEQKMQQRFT